MNAKSDCTVGYQPGGVPLSVQVISSVDRLFGGAIEQAARAAAADLRVDQGELTIQDDGALDYVIAARVEAALRAAGFKRPIANPTRTPGHERQLNAEGARDRRRRTRLYLPGNLPDLAPNAGLFGADCLILDLEDSVPPGRKEEARILVRSTLASHPDFFRAAEIVVRMNPLSGLWGAEDLEELAACLPDAIILPKCESASDVERLASELDRLESRAKNPRKPTLIMPLVESARGVLSAAAIAAASPRVAALCFGAEDFAADIGARRTSAGMEALVARQSVVLAAKAAGAQALDSVFSDVEDAEGFAAYCAASRAMGFDGVGIVHPRQIADANRLFSPTDDELDHARQVVKALAEAEAGGSGVATYAGKMIDAPVARWARRIIDSASEEER